MSLIEQYKKFLDEIGWEEFSNVEKQYLFEDINEKDPFKKGILFNIHQGKPADGYVTVEHKSTKSKLEIRQEELKDFRIWLEKTYAGGEDGESFFAWKDHLEKEDRRDVQEDEYEYQQMILVASKLKEYFSPHNITHGQPIIFGT